MKAMFFEFLNGMIKSATGGPTSPPVPMKAAPMKAAPMKAAPMKAAPMKISGT